MALKRGYMVDNWVTRSMSGGVMEQEKEPHIDEDLLDEQVVVLIQGVNIFGDKIFSYLQLPLRSFRELAKKMRASEKFTPSDYGTVVAAGRGEPSSAVKQEMAVTYKMIDVPQARPAPQAAAPFGAKAPNFTAPKFWDEE